MNCYPLQQVSILAGTGEVLSPTLELNPSMVIEPNVDDASTRQRQLPSLSVDSMTQVI